MSNTLTLSHFFSRKIRLLSLFLCLPLIAVSQVNDAERYFKLEISHRQIAAQAPTLRVKQGELVQLAWRSDEAAQIHLHGYDLMLTLSASRAGQESAAQVMQFKASILGRFSVVAHNFSSDHGAHAKHQREVPLLYLEVLPP